MFDTLLRSSCFLGKNVITTLEELSFSKPSYDAGWLFPLPYLKFRTRRRVPEIGRPRPNIKECVLVGLVDEDISLRLSLCVGPCQLLQVQVLFVLHTVLYFTK